MQIKTKFKQKDVHGKEFLVDAKIDIDGRNFSIGERKFKMYRVWFGYNNAQYMEREDILRFSDVDILDWGKKGFTDFYFWNKPELVWEKIK